MPSEGRDRPLSGRLARVGTGLAILGIAGAAVGAVLTGSTVPEPTTTVQRSAVFYDGFEGVDGLTFRGSAKVVGDVVELTERAPRYQTGAVWYASRQPVAEGFETAFAFQIDHVSWWTIGDGFAFVIQTDGERAMGGGAAGNGYEGITRSLAVEFDTVRHGYKEDPFVRIPAGAPGRLSNHVSFQTGRRQATSAHNNHSIASSGIDTADLFDRIPHLALIRYEPGTLEVFVDDLDTPVLSATVFLDRLLDLDDGTAWVGFTAGTEDGYYSGHRITGWEFNSPCLPVTNCGAPQG